MSFSCCADETLVGKRVDEEESNPTEPNATAGAGMWWDDFDDDAVLNFLSSFDGGGSGSGSGSFTFDNFSGFGDFVFDDDYFASVDDDFFGDDDLWYSDLDSWMEENLDFDDDFYNFDDDWVNEFLGANGDDGEMSALWGWTGWMDGSDGGADYDDSWDDDLSWLAFVDDDGIDWEWISQAQGSGSGFGAVDWSLYPDASSTKLSGPARPGSCKRDDGSLRCGVRAFDTTCMCERSCTFYGDCCADYVEICEAPILEHRAEQSLDDSADSAFLVQCATLAVGFSVASAMLV
jgi:hypothetical protein